MEAHFAKKKKFQEAALEESFWCFKLGLMFQLFEVLLAF
jgi:hypothetical protein